ncbi:MAG: hypothetical protein QXU87_03950 [Candidatus Caldarchaeum sp.]
MREEISQGSGAASVGPGAAGDARQAQTLYQVGGKRLVCRINAEFPVFNLKVTTFKITVFTSLQLKQYRQLYLVATSYTPYSNTFTAPEGAIVLPPTGGVYIYLPHHKFLEILEGREAELVVSSGPPFNRWGICEAFTKAKLTRGDFV